ncbi:hypothetical protein Rhopal_005650-T1 [Rhodotorula paludigena]|uniref:Transcription factor domain-containing protein n=1 Tax=Rhodotorula paludigena TaxID=86838 RepID=A0AAV5GJ47_9BASI|nr:hypothetical protein Rhopal_005650-T1 [Rhodotorula paludigena]
MDPASGKVKARATRHPCRRCELYGIECLYPEGQVPKTAVRVQVGASGSAPPSSTAPVSNGTSIPAPAPSGGNEGELARAIRDMNARLVAIEAGLEADRRAGLRPVASTSSFALPDLLPLPVPPLPSTSSSTPLQHDPIDLPVDSNPLQVLVSTMEQMSRDEQAMDDDEVGGSNAAGLGGENAVDEEYDMEELSWKARNEPRSGRPDAFARGLVTLEDVQTAFTFYVQRLQPWIPVVERRPSLVVREKNYNTSTSSRAREVYAGLNAIVHELLVGYVLAPEASMFTRDFVRALLLMLYYKPVQTSAYAHRGIKSSSRIVHASKVNALSSLMIHSLIQRAASFIGVHQSPALLVRVLDNPDLAPPEERKRALAEFRLWCTVIAADALGSLQSGRLTWTDPAAALRVNRRFAALAADPTDVRRAAVLELYSIVTLPTSAPPSTHPVRYRLDHLKQINAELDAWRAYWTPVLTEAQNKGDPLAYTVLQTLAQFVILAVNGGVYTRWDLERKKELEEGKEGRPRLSGDDWRHLERAAQAADTAIFVVSTEATASGSPLRDSTWPAPVNGVREVLHLDPRITEDFKTALDTMTCIAFVYSLLFLVRMAAAGLITCDLEIRRTDYEAGCNLDTPQPLITGQKLPRLLELGAQFLTGISPNPDHPARRHALLVEMILRVGLSAASPQVHNASSPASTTHRRSPIVPNAPSPSVLAPLAAPPNALQAPHLQPPSSTALPTLANPPIAVAATASGAARLPVSSFDSWLWDTSTPTSTSLSGPLRMQDGSFVMPDLSVSAAAGASGAQAGASPAVASTPSPFASGAPRPTTTPAQATALAAGAGRKGMEAMASLLSEVTPFMDDFCMSLWKRGWPTWRA